MVGLTFVMLNIYEIDLHSPGIKLNVKCTVFVSYSSIFFLIQAFFSYSSFCFFYAKIGKHFSAPNGNRARDFMNSSGVADSIPDCGTQKEGIPGILLFPVPLCRDFVFFSVFYNEVLDTIRNGISSKVNPENLVLEINASK